MVICNLDWCFNEFYIITPVHSCSKNDLIYVFSDPGYDLGDGTIRSFLDLETTYKFCGINTETGVFVRDKGTINMDEDLLAKASLGIIDTNAESIDRLGTRDNEIINIISMYRNRNK